MEVYEERFCESRNFGRKMSGADCVYYRLKESIFVDVAGSWITGSKSCAGRHQINFFPCLKNEEALTP
jgi:hypothetical protein